MNSTMHCPNCTTKFSRTNPPKKLKNCSHSLCDNCLTTSIKCNLDHKKIQYRRYAPFELDQVLLDAIQGEGKSDSPVKTREPSRKEGSPGSGGQMREYEMCLLHSKPADIICYQDGNLICASCALFGQHRGHPIKNCPQFLNSLTHYTEQALQIFDKLKQKEENLNQQVIQQYVQDCLQQRRKQQIKNIKQAFIKLIEKIKKIEKNVLAKLDMEIKNRKEFLMKEVSIYELQAKKNQWYREVENLGNVTQGVYQFRGIQEGLRYFDDKYPESFLLKRGEYLFLQYSSSQNLIKSKIDNQTSKLTIQVSQPIQKSLQQYCTIPSLPLPHNQLKSPLHLSSLKQSKITIIQDKSPDQDILIDTAISKLDFCCELASPHRRDRDRDRDRDSTNGSQLDSRSGYLIGIKIPEVNVVQSVLHQDSLAASFVKGGPAGDLGYRTQRSKSTRKKSVADAYNREILATVDNKKKKKIDIPDKYKQVFDDLKNDRSEVIDFGGAELGDQNILGLCEYIQKTSKLRNLKLVRNKISDDVVKQILSACFCAKVTSLNLGQNSLTEKSLEMLQNFDLGELRNITLSLNKINRRNVKARLDDFVRRGITLSI